MPNLDNYINELLSGDDERAEAAALKFEQFGRSAVSALEKLLSNSNSDTRWWAIRGLAEIHTEEISGILIAALQDKDLAVKQCTLMAMRKRPDNSYIPHLISHLRNQDGLVSSLAADALMAIGKDAAPSLLGVLESGTLAEKRLAVRALATIAHYDFESVSALFKLLDSDSAVLVYWAELGLRKMGVGMTFFEPDP